VTKVLFDIEAMLPWQQNIFDQITAGGFKPGEMMVISAGRQTGKSMFTQQAIERLMRDLNSQPVSDLTLSEGTVYGTRYYCVEPVGGNWPDMETWCLDTYGNPGSAWDKNKAPEPNARWYMNDRRFWFRKEQDRDWFIIRWRS
jgi:hypothetical protein